MRHLTLRLIVALLTFTLGITAVSLWLISHHSSPIVRHEENNTSSPAPPLIQQKRTYERGTTGEAISKDGTAGSVSSFYSSDGMRFSSWSEYYNSPERADREMQRTLKKAKEIIKREPLFDEHGQQIGEKVIATFPANIPYYGAASLLSTKASTFSYVSSSSLQNILEYEKDFNR